MIIFLCMCVLVVWCVHVMALESLIVREAAAQNWHILSETVRESGDVMHDLCCEWKGKNKEEK